MEENFVLQCFQPSILPVSKSAFVIKWVSFTTVIFGVCAVDGSCRINNSAMVNTFKYDKEDCFIFFKISPLTP
jgi:hypothetical protein